MSVIAGGRSEEPAVRPRRRWPVAVIAALAAVTLLLTGPPEPSEPPSDPQISPPVPAPDLPAEWVAAGSFTARYLEPGLAGERFLIQVEGTPALLDAQGRVTWPVLAGLEQYRGVVTRETTVVAYGMATDGPSLWIPTASADVWEPVPLPWEGSVQAVTVADDGVVVLGTDTDGWISARHPLPLDGDPGAWTVTSIDPPGTVVFGVRGGFVARSLLQDEYLHSDDGREWSSHTEVMIHPVGEVAALVSTPTGLGLQMSGDERTVVPPEWPVSALWRIQDRIWIQTPTAAWWTTDGRRWQEIRFDEEKGFPGGRPVLLPFPDRALIAVGPSDLARRDLFTWYVGG
ncbi:MAG: hypothetical protein R3246_04755 [Acidimicrobiia bacterium]|nr:hypothetical protein [Acidimicrobiia bacterium]